MITGLFYVCSILSWITQKSWLLFALYCKITEKKWSKYTMTILFLGFRGTSTIGWHRQDTRFI